MVKLGLYPITGLAQLAKLVGCIRPGQSPVEEEGQRPSRKWLKMRFRPKDF